ncbi:MAG: protoporphyrinogen oxidase [Parvularcula sp.]|jgi:oxygen-dependent protoporphyrinogen oxidase|nr:protoporphyrinogen oxidase [Parvularcula sp.]
MRHAENVIIGGGLAGLSAGARLRQEGESVAVIDRAEVPGGVIRTDLSDDGFLSEQGPNSLQVRSKRVASFLQSIGLDADRMDPKPEARRRFIVREGELIALPSGPLSFARTKWISSAAKRSLLKEPFRSRRETLDTDESLADFVRRRLGQEFLDYGVNPLVGGIYAGDPEKLSARHGFPRLWRLEDRHGSFIRGAVAKQLGFGRDPDALRTETFSFQRGMQTLPDRLAAQLGSDWRPNTTVAEIVREYGGWSIQTESERIQARRLILAVPAFALSSLPLPDDLRVALQPLERIPYPPVTSWFLGYKRGQIQHPLDGFGVLIPEKEGASILGVVFSSSLFEGRAREDHVALTIFVGGTRQPELAERSDDALLPKVAADLKRYLGVSGDPVVSRRTHWPRAIPQIEVGFGAKLAAMEAAERDWPGLHLIGNYRGGIAAGDTIRNALALADRIGTAD